MVVPYVGTWIEMAHGMMMALYLIRRSLRGNVDRNLRQRRQDEVPYVVPYVGTWIEMCASWRSDNAWSGRSLRGNVDRNRLDDATMSQTVSRSLRGNVDRNTTEGGMADLIGKVVPYVGTWIEIETTVEDDPRVWGRSLRGNVDRNLL